VHGAGLGFDTSALALLEGMPVHEECVHAAQVHLQWCLRMGTVPH
jgi:hypothetical protein